MKSKYNYDSKTLFLTLCIGAEYIEKTTTLIQSVCKFTSSRLKVYTDVPKSFDEICEFYGEQLVVVDIKYENYRKEIKSVFNYHLKYIPFFDSLDDPEQALFYLDCDTFLFGWESGYSRYLNSLENCMIARTRENLSECLSLSNVLKIKQDDYVRAGSSVDFTKINKPLIIENAFIVSKGFEACNFIREWKNISEYAIMNDIYPFVESAEMAIRLEQAGLTVVTLTPKMPIADSVRTLHGNSIISTWII
jgi:hypothetical protein